MKLQENLKREKYNVSLLGASLDVSNQGCRAMAASLIKLIVDSKPNARIHLIYGNKTGGTKEVGLPSNNIKVNILNYRLSLKAKPNEHLLYILFLVLIQRIMPFKFIKNKIIQSNKILNTLYRSNLVGLIHGGDSFSDIYGLRQFLFGIIPCFIIIIMKIDYVMLPQTYGPFKYTIAKLLARFILLHAKNLYARDRESINFLRNVLQIKEEHKDIHLCPDVAFIMQPKMPDKMNINPKLDHNQCHPLIGLNISGLLYIGGYSRNNMFGLKVNYKDFMQALLKWLMEQTDAHVILIPHVYWSGQEGNEPRICKDMRMLIDKIYQDRIHLVMQKYDQNEIKGIISMCDFFIGARMHACIAALSQDIPTVGLAYSKKFYGVFQTVGAENYVADMRNLSQEELIDVINCTFENRIAVKKILQPMTIEAKKRIVNSFKEIIV